jgi:pathogenesis-related protein 1
MRYISIALVALISQNVLAITALNHAQQQEMVSAHNTWRAKVGISPVVWSNKIANIAQEWANHLKTQGCKMQHSTGNYGENLYWASPLKYSDGRSSVQNISSTKVVDSWGNEVKNYSYNSNSCANGKICGHYTQVVWKTSTEVGCGIAVCGDFSQVWVCNYNPPGNYRGQKPY